MERLKKHKTIPFLNVGTSSAESWARIGKSTIFELALNPNEVESNFIEDEMPTKDIDYYQPSLDQELQTNKGDAAFDFLYDMYYNLPTGEDLKKDFLLVFAGNIGTPDAPQFNAWKCEVTIVINTLNTVEEKITFTININKIERGTAVVAAGVPTFTPA